MGVATGIIIMWLWSTPVTRLMIKITNSTGVSMGTDFSHITTGMAILNIIINWWGPLLVISVFIIWGLYQSFILDPNSEPS